jgi:hypothetical protein
MEEFLICSASLSGLLGIAALLGGSVGKNLAPGIFSFPKQTVHLDCLQVLKRLWAKPF